MTSKIKVDNINKVSDDSNIINKCGTDITMGQNGDTVIIPNGVTEQVQSGGAIQVQSGGSITIASGATITNNGTAVGLGRTGTVDWATTPVTATFTAANGVGYFCNTSGGAFTVNLPAGSAGAIVSLADYAATWQTNALTVSPNGSEKIGSVNADVTLSTEGQSVTLVYVDGTQGWINTMDSTSNVRGNPNLVASVSGACNTLVTAPCCANVKIATFTGPGSFIVSNLSTTAANNTIGYMVIAGGGGGSGGAASGARGGGGAGGYREGRNVPIDNYTASPLVANAPTNALTVTAQSYPIVVGGGGAGTSSGNGSTGSNSVFDSITGAGGGSGNSDPGGSGGGGSYNTPAGTGNTPPVSPPQGNPGGVGIIIGGGQTTSGGGGGANGAGNNGSPSPNDARGGVGGNGIENSITGSPVTRAGGGNGSGEAVSATFNPTQAPGGGGAGNGNHGATNKGSGGSAGSPSSGNGGSGIVVIRYKFQ